MSGVCAQSGVGVKGEGGPMTALPTRSERARGIGSTVGLQW